MCLLNVDDGVGEEEGEGEMILGPRKPFGLIADGDGGSSATALVDAVDVEGAVCPLRPATVGLDALFVRVK